MTDDALRILTIYDRPADYPGHVVARFGFAHRDPPVLSTSPRAWLFSSVEAARRWVREKHPDLVCIPRSPEDPPQIVESYI